MFRNRDTELPRRRAGFGRSSIALLAVAALAVAGCSSGSGGKSGGNVSEVRIGVPAPLSGLGKAFGESYVAGLQLTVDAINAAGGVKSMGGAKLKLVIEDDQSDPARGVQLLNKMAKDVSVFTGPLLSASLVGAIPTFGRVKVPFVGVPLDNAVTDQNSEWVFRLTNRASALGDQLFQFIQEEGKTSVIKSVGIVGINAPPGTSATESAKANAEKAGWKITKIDYDQKTTTDFAPIVAKLREANVDLVTGFQNSADALLFAKAIAAQSWRPAQGFIWLAGAQTLASYKSTLGATVDGWADITYAGPVALQPSASAELKQLAENYKTKTGQELNLFAASAPNVIAIIAAALEAGKSAQPDKLRDALRKLEFSDGAQIPYYTFAGGVKFAANGDNTAWQPQVYQLDSANTKTGEPVVWPEKYAVKKMKWPADNK